MTYVPYPDGQERCYTAYAWTILTNILNSYVVNELDQ